MTILFLIFVIQFTIATVCLYVSYPYGSELVEIGWKKLDNKTRDELQSDYHCCGFKNATLEGITCKSEEYLNTPCYTKFIDVISQSLKLTGTVGLIFSFTQVISQSR